jgi:hypothetical protein
MKIFVLFFFSLFIGIVGSAQRSATNIAFAVKFNQTNLILNKKYYLETKQDSVTITKLKFYISNISLYKNAKKIYTLPQKYFLIDMENENTQKINMPNIAFDSICFLIGIDSMTNEKGVQAGSLDPTNNMYWAWQSGYINFKLEGVYSNKNIFQYHIGGYKYPYNTIQHFSSKVLDNKPIIEIDIARLLNNISDTDMVMSPNENAVKISAYIKNSFTIQ